MFLGGQTFHWSGVLQDLPDHLPANRHRRRVQDDQQDRHYLRLQVDRVPQREAEGRPAQPDPLPGVRPEEGDRPQHLYVQNEHHLQVVEIITKYEPDEANVKAKQLSKVIFSCHYSRQNILFHFKEI